MYKFSTFSYSSLTDLNSFKAKEIIVWMRLQTSSKEDLLNLSMVKFNIDYDDALRIYEKAFIYDNYIIKSAFFKESDLDYIFEKDIQNYIINYINNQEFDLIDLAQKLEETYRYSTKEVEYFYKNIEKFFENIQNSYPINLSEERNKDTYRKIIPNIWKEYEVFKNNFIAKAINTFPYNEDMINTIKSYLYNLKNFRTIISNIMYDNTDLESFDSYDEGLKVKIEREKENKELVKKELLKLFPNTTQGEISKQLNLLDNVIKNKTNENILSLYKSIGNFGEYNFPQDIGETEAIIALNQFIKSFNEDQDKLKQYGSGLSDRLRKEKTKKQINKEEVEQENKLENELKSLEEERNKEEQEKIKEQEKEQEKIEHAKATNNINIKNIKKKYKKYYRIYDNYYKDYKRLKEYADSYQFQIEGVTLPNFITSKVENKVEELIIYLRGKGKIKGKEYKSLIEDKAKELADEYFTYSKSMLEFENGAPTSDTVLKAFIFYLNAVVIKNLSEGSK